MHDKQSLLEEYRKVFTTWSEEELNGFADMMAKKYSTIKKGDNVVHLDYYHGLIDDNDITTIESTLASVNIELSRFDKNGVPYASLEQFMLQVALFLGDKTTQDVLSGVGTNALWDAIKSVTFHVWRTIQKRAVIKPANSKRTLNCGIKMTLDSNTKFEFRIDGDFSDETVIKSIDKILEFLKIVTPNQNSKRPDFVTYNQEKECWEVVDVNEEMRKLMLAAKEKEKDEQKDN
jgi:hypothetical protein